MRPFFYKIRNHYFLSGHKKLGKRGTAALPHAAFFQELQGLVADGVALVRGRRGYSQVGSGEGKGESSAKRSRGKRQL